MGDVLDQFGSPNEAAVIAAGRNGHTGLVPVLVEVASRTYDPAAALTIAEALEAITGETVGGDFVLAVLWFSWMSHEYRASPDAMFPAFMVDGRIPEKDNVAGISSDNESKTFPVDVTAAERVINTTVGDIDLVLMGHP